VSQWYGFTVAEYGVMVSGGQFTVDGGQFVVYGCGGRWTVYGYGGRWTVYGYGGRFAVTVVSDGRLSSSSRWRLEKLKKSTRDNEKSSRRMLK
jgi:hypothetical protein